MDPDFNKAALRLHLAGLHNFMGHKSPPFIDWGQSHAKASNFSVSKTHFHARQDCPDLQTSPTACNPGCVHHQNLQTCPLRSETAEELNHTALVPSFYLQSWHRNMWPTFQKSSTAWGLCGTSAWKHNSGNSRIRLWKAGLGWEDSENWPRAPEKVVLYDQMRKSDRLMAQKGASCNYRQDFALSLK